MSGFMKVAFKQKSKSEFEYAWRPLSSVVQSVLSEVRPLPAPKAIVKRAVQLSFELR